MSAAPETKVRTFQGVFLPSILTILGIILYLRMGWVVGSAGLFASVVIILLSSSVTLLTGLSLAAIATNMRVRAGGAYYIVSRSLGIEAGAAIGLPLLLAQAFGVSFYVAGFVEAFGQAFPISIGLPIGALTIVAIAVVSIVSRDLALRIQMWIFVIIAVSLVSLFLGVYTLDDDTKQALLTAESFQPESFQEVPFWTILAIFFPAVTGIEAGISMSGDLRRPERSLPLGTISAVLVGAAVYLAVAYSLAGILPAYVLQQNRAVFEEVSFSSLAFYAGIWGASLSSALGAMMGGARTLQALASDRVLPRFLSRQSERFKGPDLATGVVAAVAISGTFMGGIDLIAPVLSMFFLTSYGALNTIAFMESVLSSASWRPLFRVPWQVSGLGALSSVIMMLMIDSGSALVAMVALAAVYFFVKKRQYQTNWGDLRSTMLRAMLRYAVYHLDREKHAERSWIPNIVFLTGSSNPNRDSLLVAHSVCQGVGVLTVAPVIKPKKSEGDISPARIATIRKSIRDSVQKAGVEALVRVLMGSGDGASLLTYLQNYGLGGLSPNVVWLTMTPSDDPPKVSEALLAQAHVGVQQGKSVLLCVTGGEESGSFEDDEEGRGFTWRSYRRRARIQLHYLRSFRYLSFGLLLTTLLRRSAEWRDAELAISGRSNLSEKERAGIQTGLEGLLKRARMNARFISPPQQASLKSTEESPMQPQPSTPAETPADLMIAMIPFRHNDVESPAVADEDKTQSLRALEDAINETLEELPDYRMGLIAICDPASDFETLLVGHS